MKEILYFQQSLYQYSAIFKSFDLGASWTMVLKLTGSSNARIYDIAGFNGKYFVAVTDKGFIYTSSNYGSSFARRSSLPANLFGVFICSSSGVALAVGVSNSSSGRPAIFRASNSSGYTSWSAASLSSQAQSLSGQLNGVSGSSDGLFAVAVGSKGSLFTLTLTQSLGQGVWQYSSAASSLCGSTTTLYGVSVVQSTTSSSVRSLLLNSRKHFLFFKDLFFFTFICSLLYYCILILLLID